MPLELATDLATLALYDVVIFADDSGSMVFEEGGERIDDLKLILGRVAEVGHRPHSTSDIAVCCSSRSDLLSSVASHLLHLNGILVKLNFPCEMQLTAFIAWRLAVWLPLGCTDVHSHERGAQMPSPPSSSVASARRSQRCSTTTASWCAS